MRAIVAGVCLALCAWTAVAADVVTPKEHRRGVEQTFLTFPEWFLVHSPAELAAFVREHPPSDFPFYGHVRQFWSSYSDVRKAVAEYPPNPGYHLMICVIGVSTTVEYMIRWWYGTTVGRLSALAMDHGMTEEDKFGAVVAQDYVDFIRVLPWYEYDFAGKLKRLWSETTLWGNDPLRKWERKYALTTEYAVKAIYGWLIKLGTRSVYEPALLVTAVVVDRVPDGLEKELPDMKVGQGVGEGGTLLIVPRYEAFMKYSTTLASHGAQFEEIAGNDGAILLSVLTPPAWKPTCDCHVLFRQPILTVPGRERVALVTTVPELAGVLNGLRQPDVHLEHVYDY